MDKLLVDELSQPLIDIYNGIETDLLTNIASKLKDKKELLDTDPEAWQLQMMQNLGLLTKENIGAIKHGAWLTSGEFNNVLLSAGLEGLEVNEEIMANATKKGAKLLVPPPVSESPKILETLTAYGKQASDALNLTNQTMLLQANKIYTDIINRTAFDVISGTMTGQQALRKTIKQWGEQGVPALIDSAGRQWSPEGYVRTVLRSTTGNVVSQMQDDRFEEYGVSHVEVSSHAGARPKCAPYQGKVFSLKAGDKEYPPLSSTSMGQIDGLFGINCGHTKYAFIPGISTQRFQPNDTEENAKIYKESQQQRAIERSIRKAKTQQRMLEAAGDNEGALKLKETISLRQAKMRKFIKDTGRTRRSGREQIVGLNDIKQPAIKPIVKKAPKAIKPDVIKDAIKDVPKAPPLHPDVAKWIANKEAKEVPKVSEFAQNIIDEKNKSIIKQLKQMSPEKAGPLLKRYESGEFDHVYTLTGWDGPNMIPLIHQYNPKSEIFYRINDNVADDIKALALKSFDEAEKFSEITKGAVVNVQHSQGVVSGYSSSNKIIVMSHKQTHRLVSTDNGTGFLDTLMHEMGHREHYDVINEKTFAEFKKAVNPYYSNDSQDLKKLGLKDAKRDWEFVVNAKHWEKGGKKSDYHYEMHAEGFSIFTTGTAAEKAIMQKAFPEMFDFFSKNYGSKIKDSSKAQAYKAAMQAGLKAQAELKAKVDAAKAAIKEEPLFGGFTKKQIAESNKKNIEIIEKALAEGKLSGPFEIKAKVLLNHYKVKGTYDEINTVVRFDGKAIIKEDISIKEVEEIKAVVKEKVKDVPTPKVKINRRPEDNPTSYKFIDKNHEDVLRDAEAIKSFTDDQKEVVEMYTGTSFKAINRALRNGVDEATSDYIKNIIDELSGAIEENAKPLTDDTMFIRRMDKSAAEFLMPPELKRNLSKAFKYGRTSDEFQAIKKAVMNGTVTDGGFISTSYRYDIFEKDMGFEFQIHAPKGYTGGMFVESISSVGWEAEYLMKAGTSFRVFDVDIINGGLEKFQRIIFKVEPIEP